LTRRPGARAAARRSGRSRDGIGDRHPGADEEAPADSGRTGAAARSAIVEPKRKPLIDDYDPEAHRRAGEKADELFREIVRRAAKRD